MKILIVYSTHHGCTEKCAFQIKDKLNAETDIVKIKGSNKFDLSVYDLIIIGGSIHAGKIQRHIKKFCEKNMDILTTKQVGLFMCCMEEGDTAQTQFNNAFPKELIEHAQAKEIVGGEFNFDKMNAIEKFMVKKIAGIEQSVSKISEEQITNFVAQLFK